MRTQFETCAISNVVDSPRVLPHTDAKERPYKLKNVVFKTLCMRVLESFDKEVYHYCIEGQTITI